MCPGTFGAETGPQFQLLFHPRGVGGNQPGVSAFCEPLGDAPSQKDDSAPAGLEG